MREHHTAQSLNAWLDTPAGEALAAMHGGRYQAAAAMAEAEAQDRAWRRQQAEARFERFPGRYESPAHAMADIADPAGGPAMWLEGSTDEVVAQGRRVNPAAGWRNLGGEMPDAVAEGVVQMPGRAGQAAVAPADTRPPWRRT